MKQKQLEKFSSFDRDPVIRNGFILAGLFWLASAGSIAWLYRWLPPVLPLFYSMTRGQLQLAEKPYLLLLPILSLVFLLTHFIFSWLNYSQDMVFARIMTISASLGTFVFAVAVGHILWIVI